MKFRPYLLKAHAWTGLVVGLLLVFVAFTGTGLAFRADLETAGSRDRKTPGAPAELPALGLMIARASELHPSSRPTLVQFDTRADVPVLIRFADGQVCCFDPHTHDVLPANSRFASWLVTFTRLHTFAFWENGGAVAGSLALVVIMLALSGIHLCWPATLRAARAMLAVSRRLIGFRRVLNLHKTLGLYASLFLLVSALTGLPVAFTWARRAVYRSAGSAIELPPAASPARATSTLSLDELARVVAQTAPGPHHTTIRYRAGGLVECYLIGPDAPHPNARTSLFIDASSGAVLSHVPYERSSAGHRLYYWMLSIHTGRAAGLAGQLAILFGALTLPILVLTGTASYLRRAKSSAVPLPARTPTAS